MTGLASGLRLPSAILLLLLVLPAVAQSAPVILPPVLAIVNDPDNNPANCFVPISITGSGFGDIDPDSKVTVTNTTDSTTEIYPADDISGSVVFWGKTRVVIKLPCTLSHPRVTVHLADGTKSAAVTADRYEYTFFPTDNDPTNPNESASGFNSPPLAVTNDGAKGYLLDEFSWYLKRWDLETGTVSKASDYPAHETSLICTDCFANPLFPDPQYGDPNGNGIPDEDEKVQFTGLGESAIVDDKGRIWFSQGGALLYGGLGGNHSRIISFDPKIAKTAANPYRIYNVPGANNQVKGLAWDKARQRIWFSSEARHTGGCGRPESIHKARLVSFDPDTIHPDVYDPNFSFTVDPGEPTCSEGPLTWVEHPVLGPTRGWTTGTAGVCEGSMRACYTADDCVLANHVCDANATDANDDDCFREYPLTETIIPPPSGQYCLRYYGASAIGHLAVSSVDDSIWFTSYKGRNPIDPGDLSAGVEVFVGRLELEPEGGAAVLESHFPLYNVAGGLIFHNGPWEIEETANGDMAITLDSKFSLARFDVSRVDDPPACLELVSSDTAVDCSTTINETCMNPCIDVLELPGFDSQNSHSVVEDELGNIWFSLYGGQGGAEGSPTFGTDSASIGIWKADRTGPVMFPSFSLYDDSSRPDDECPNTGYRGFAGAGMTINKNNGDVWFADFCRKRIGRLRKAECDCE